MRLISERPVWDGIAFAQSKLPSASRGGIEFRDWSGLLRAAAAAAGALGIAVDGGMDDADEDAAFDNVDEESDTSNLLEQARTDGIYH